ncbi:hypothetical protein B0H13DRAFT_2306710 [Mycena leptocephala]|nr:hypothetical protein B0H13DRAFT_2306710 [Mycena leptocephala]
MPKIPPSGSGSGHAEGPIKDYQNTLLDLQRQFLAYVSVTTEIKVFRILDYVANVSKKIEDHGSL